eukprot:TRINITY_DN6363_c0_g1_i3.p1 TRINITY_DN6363_c0_g1~~TRINITY_DN6363_c0_g1_i3.p1  ORF type:complete len:621 (+),score=109.23 TRINITY_DN6363_c0_g1_i3:58-1920(+)
MEEQRTWEVQEEAKASGEVRDKNFHPQQTLHEFDNVVFDSRFDSGNLARVDKVRDDLFNLYITPDNAGTPFEKGYRTWFHFSVTPLRYPATITLTIKNMNCQLKLYNEGMVPVYKCLPSSPTWKRLPTSLTYKHQSDSGLEFAFSFKFEREDTVYFAFSFPWSYIENQKYFEACEETARQSKDIYFHKEVLIRSREKRNVDLITISSTKGMSNEREPMFYALFPEKGQRPNLFPSKKYIFVSARVHPGETPSSWVLKGLVDFLLDTKDERSAWARDNFVFVIVPILNPDGVYRGNYRTDTYGLNLNRFYISPSLTEHPSIFASKEIILNLKAENRLLAYFDLHAHATKKGCFIFGNALEFRSQIDCCLIPKLMSMNCAAFEYESCDFTERNMYAKDRGDGLSKEGSGRVALYKATNLNLFYTLECNYNMGRTTNVTVKPARVDPDEERKHPELVPSYETLMNMKSEMNYNTPFYVQKSFEEVGESIAVSILDMFELNPLSRVAASSFRNVANVKMSIGLTLIKKMPFRLDPYLRKLNKNLDENMEALSSYIEKNIQGKVVEEQKSTNEKRLLCFSKARPPTKQVGKVAIAKIEFELVKANNPVKRVPPVVKKLTSLPRIK